jgi:hypothetical protein
MNIFRYFEIRYSLFCGSLFSPTGGCQSGQFEDQETVPFWRSFISGVKLKNKHRIRLRRIRVELIAKQEGMIMVKPKFKAPDADVLLSDGSEKRLRDLWQRQTLVLVFLRHFG